MNRNIKQHNGMPSSRFCQMTADGRIEICDQPGAWPYRIRAHSVDKMRGFAEWIEHLSEKVWFTPEVCADFTAFVCHLKHESPHTWAAWVRQSGAS